MIKKCSKCEMEFNCRHDEIIACHCVQVPISEQGKRYLTESFKGCLCNNCLKEVAAMFSEEKQKP